MDFIKLYIVIGSKNPLFTGDHEAYQKQDAFTMEYNQRLSALVLPQSEDNAYTFSGEKLINGYLAIDK